MAIKFLSGQTITGNITLSGDITAATFNSLAINSTGTNNVANQIVRTQANGYANFGWINSVSGNHTGSITRITASNDAYLRYVTPAQFRTGVTDGYYASAGTVDGVTSVATGNGLSGGTITSTGTLTMSGSYTGDFTVTGNLDVTNTSTATIKVGTTGVADASVDIRGYDAGVHIGDATNGLRWAIWNDGPSTSSSLKFGSYALGTWYADGSQVVTMKSDGKVGIGTTSPNGKLTILEAQAANKGDFDFQQIVYNGGWSQNADGLAAIQWSDATGSSNTIGRIGVTYTGSQGEFQIKDLYNGGYAGSGKVFAVRGDGRAYFTGDLGIGTNSPSAQLHNYSTATTNVFITGYGTAAQNDWLAQNAMFVKTDNGLLISKQNANNNTNRLFSFYNDSNGYAQLYMYTGGSTPQVQIKTSGNSYFNGGNVGIGTTSPDLKLTVNGAIQRKNKRGNTGKHSVGHYDRGEAVWELDPTMSSQEIADLFGGTTSTVYWDQTSGQSSLAPGGWCLYLAGGVSVGGVYNSGFPYLPVETDSPTQADYYMECYIQNVGTSQTHYMGSNEFNEGFTSLGGHPGSYGYWVMSNTDPGTSWTKVSGYIGGFSASTIGTFENGTKYWTPQALFNYGAGSGTRACRISGWKVYKVYQKGNRKLAGTLDVNSNINSETGYVRKSGVTSGGYIELGSLPGYGANAYQSLTSGGTIHFANNGKYCAYFEGANTYFGILNSSLQTQVKFNTNGNSYINGGYLGIGNTTPGGTRSKLGVSFNVTGSAASLAESVTYATMELYPYRNGSTYGMFFGNKGLTDGYIQSANNVGGASGHIFLNPFGGNIGIGTGNTSPTAAKLVVAGKVMINNANAPNNLAQLNIGYTGSGETRAIDIDGGWSGGESKSISFTYNASATNLVGQINCRHDSPGSRIRWGKLYHSGDSSTYTMELISSSQTTANLTVAGNITAAADVIAYSDERLKTNIKTLDGSRVFKMRGVSFEKEGKKGSGVIAQELEKVAPELVNNDSEYKGVAYGNLTGYLIEAIKEQQKQIEDLQAQIKNISNTN